MYPQPLNSFGKLSKNCKDLFQDCGHRAPAITVLVQSRITKESRIQFTCISELYFCVLCTLNCLHFVPIDKEPVTTQALLGSKTLKLSASLSGGKGDNAWQHAQLFRQNISSLNEFPLDVLVTLCTP